jgi:hypothetical protein
MSLVNVMRPTNATNPPQLTVEEAAQVLRIGRTSAVFDSSD